MSLPSRMKFYKNDELVASVFCNCGWFWDGDMKKLFTETQGMLKDFGGSVEEQCKEEFELSKKYLLDETTEWDYVVVYETRIDRDEMIE